MPKINLLGIEWRTAKGCPRCCVDPTAPFFALQVEGLPEGHPVQGEAEGAEVLIPSQDLPKQAVGFQCLPSAAVLASIDSRGRKPRRRGLPGALHPSW